MRVGGIKKKNQYNRLFLWMGYTSGSNIHTHKKNKLLSSQFRFQALIDFPSIFIFLFFQLRVVQIKLSSYVWRVLKFKILLLALIFQQLYAFDLASNFPFLFVMLSHISTMPSPSQHIHFHPFNKERIFFSFNNE